MAWCDPRTSPVSVTSLLAGIRATVDWRNGLTATPKPTPPYGANVLKPYVGLGEGRTGLCRVAGDVTYTPAPVEVGDSDCACARGRHVRGRRV
eukprot:4649140-Prymnesium_polylepis.1